MCFRWDSTKGLFRTNSVCWSIRRSRSPEHDRTLSSVRLTKRLVRLETPTLIAQLALLCVSRLAKFWKLQSLPAELFFAFRNHIGSYNLLKTDEPHRKYTAHPAVSRGDVSWAK